MKIEKGPAKRSFIFFLCFLSLFLFYLFFSLAASISARPSVFILAPKLVVVIVTAERPETAGHITTLAKLASAAPVVFRSQTCSGSERDFVSLQLHLVNYLSFSLSLSFALCLYLYLHLGSNCTHLNRFASRLMARLSNC